MQVHLKGKPFFDRSGDRLRMWMDIKSEEFYDLRYVSVLPTAFCFPGYDQKGADLPPPRICWETWHHRCLQHINGYQLRILTGAHAIRRHLGLKGNVTDIVRDWRKFAPETFVLPHPSWRNTGWLRRNPWFESEVLPELRTAVDTALTGLRAEQDG